MPSRMRSSCGRSSSVCPPKPSSAAVPSATPGATPPLPVTSSCPTTAVGPPPFLRCYNFVGDKVDSLDITPFNHQAGGRRRRTATVRCMTWTRLLPFVDLPRRPRRELRPLLHVQPGNSSHGPTGEYRLLLGPEAQDGCYVYTLGSGLPPRHVDIDCPDVEEEELIYPFRSVLFHGSLPLCIGNMIIAFNTIGNSSVCSTPAAFLTSFSWGCTSTALPAKPAYRALPDEIVMWEILHGPTGEYRLLLGPEAQDGCYVYTLGSGLPPRHVDIDCPDVEEEELIYPSGSVLSHGSLHLCIGNMIIAFNTIAESFRQMRAPVDP
uniref:Uncharacterized protein n=1 Tax=Aegilops tauschii TaxID=37682 RepID=M8C9L2_AEGTA